jgi:aspartyl-tRNA synthetase
MVRTHSCGELRPEHVGQTVTLAGWVHRRRDHGGLRFIDLRDRYGLTQIVFEADRRQVRATAADVGQEWVLQVTGEVRARPPGQANLELATGQVEVVARELVVLNEARVPPFQVSHEAEPDEHLRLRYRYLDMRRPRLGSNLLLRHRVTDFIRHFLAARSFVEIETPMLVKSTPEGARDFIVPSRLHPGRFYALPQSPQLLKQLLMVGGMDRYFQIARCCRDEDPRADRELEFTQLDLEMSFADEGDVQALTEQLLVELTTAVSDRRVLHMPFPRLTYAESMARFGTDKPDLRYGMYLVDLTELASRSSFRLLSSAVEAGREVKAICAPGHYTRKELDELEELAKRFGAGGLIWLAVEMEAGALAARSPIAKFLTQAEIDQLLELTEAAAGHTVFITAGKAEVVAESLGRLRSELAERRGLCRDDVLAYAWIVEPPLVEWDANEGRWNALHHPFTAPHADDISSLDSRPGTVRARAYDIVANGWELGTGSVRIHRRDVQEKVFAVLGMTRETAVEQFGFLLEAFEYGAPPHAGIAPGLDRIVALLAGERNIREVIAFPKTQSGVDLLTGSPARVDEQQLAELGIRMRQSPS